AGSAATSLAGCGAAAEIPGGAAAAGGAAAGFSIRTFGLATSGSCGAVAAGRSAGWGAADSASNSAWSTSGWTSTEVSAVSARLMTLTRRGPTEGTTFFGKYLVRIRAATS